MAAQEVLIARRKSTGHVRLNRPRVLHALSRPVCAAIRQALLGWREDKQVQQILIDHRPGTRGFCGGGDVLQLIASLHQDGKAALAFFREEYQLNLLLQSYPKPIIALTDGVVMGGGVGLSAHGSHRIITERTLFAMPEVSIGLFPDVGVSRLLSRMPPGVGLWLALTGARLRGKEVLACGIGTHWIASDRIPALREAIFEHGFAAAAHLQQSAAFDCADRLEQIKSCFTGASVEEILLRLEAEGSAWAQEQSARMMKHCPVSLKVAHRQICRAATIDSFAELMRMDYRIARRIIFQPNFREGVRALLIDKDQNPQWQPKKLAAVSDAMLDAIFAPLGEEELPLDSTGFAGEEK